MSYSNGKITAPVGIYDAQRALGVSAGGDLGTLCQHVNVNMWAKYKPVQLYNVKDTTDQWDYTNNRWKKPSELPSGTRPWWYGLSNQFAGITVPGSVSNIPGFSTVAELIAAYDGGSNGWVYNKPQGNIHPFRLTDFAQYNHLAPPPVQDFYLPAQIIYDGRFNASALMSMPDENGDYISLADFSSVRADQLYFGVWFVDGTTATNTRVTSTEAGMAGVTVNLSGSGNVLQVHKTYKAYPFLSNMVLNIGDTTPSPTGLLLFPCPNVNPIDVYTVDRNETANITLDGKFRLNSTSVIDVETINGDQTAYTNCYIYLMPLEYWSDPGNNTSHAIQTITSFTLAAGADKLSQFTLTSSQIGGDYFLYATFNSGTYWRKTNILQPLTPQT